MEKDNKQNKEDNLEIHSFSEFMFGNNRHRETYNDVDIISEELPKQKDPSSFPTRPNPIDELFLGRRRKESATLKPTTQHQIEHFLNNVDFELLMETIDMFVATSKQLQPLFKEITPYLHQFRKKLNLNKKVD